MRGEGMQKIFRSIVLLIFMTVLVSCDVFLFPQEGRWNLLDPDNELEWVDVVLPAAVDGYIDANEIKYFDKTLLITDFSKQPEKAILIRFDFSKLPVQVESATLEMYATSQSLGTSVEIYVIGQVWTPATIRWPPIYDLSIVDWDYPLTYVNFPISGLDTYNYVDVSDLVKYMQKNKDTYGLLYRGSAATEFHSSRGSSPPRLRVTGWDIPD
jgi:hypothetical protein